MRNLSRISRFSSIYVCEILIGGDIMIVDVDSSRSMFPDLKIVSKVGIQVFERQTLFAWYSAIVV